MWNLMNKNNRPDTIGTVMNKAGVRFNLSVNYSFCLAHCYDGTLLFTISPVVTNLYRFCLMMESHPFTQLS
jgi:hypothetical protein